jgi:hypothetical protein
MPSSKSPDLQLLLDAEIDEFRDFIHVNVSDGLRTSNKLKSFAWWRIAAKMFKYDYIAKTDDDTLYSVKLVLHDLSSAVSKPYVYYGSMRWRLFSLREHDVCKGFVENSLDKRVRVMNVHECSSPLGPFLYADGVFEGLSAYLVREVVGSPSFGQITKRLLPSSRAEDSALGAALYNHSVYHDTNISLVYLSLRPGKHFRYWYDMRDHDENFQSVRFVHRVYNSMIARRVSYGMNHASVPPSRWACKSCAEYGAEEIQYTSCCRTRAFRRFKTL